MLGYYVLLFKQKAAYEMRISDWSSDVCSSDLRRVRARDGDGHRDADDPLAPEEGPDAPIHETEMARMPARGGLGLGQKVEIAIGQRVRHGADLVSRAHAVYFLAREIVFARSAEHTSELQSLMRILYAVCCLQEKNTN